MSTRTVVSSCFHELLQTLVVGLVLLGLFTSMVWEPAWAADSASAALPASTPGVPTAPARTHEASKPVPPTNLPNVSGQQTSAQASPAPNLSAANQLLQRQGPVFIENRGQFDSRVKFLVKGNGANLWLTNEGIVFDLQRPSQKESSDLKGAKQTLDPRLKADQPPMERLVFKQKLVSANLSPTIEARDPQPGIYNYFIGSDPDKWRTHVLAYKEVMYRDIWKGIDLKLFANGPNLEEEFIVHPGADPGSVQLAYEGIKGLSVADDGSLQVATTFGDMLETTPRIYQEIAGKSVPLSGSFKLGVQNSYTFEVAKHDDLSDLIIDPTVIYSKPPNSKKSGQGTLLYSSFLGGSQSDVGNAIAVDNAGNAYVTGTTGSSDFPTTPGVWQTTGGGVFVTKVNPLGSAPLVYSTYLGQQGYGQGIAVDPSGDAYVAGGAGGNNFPTTSNAYAGCNVNGFFTKLTPAGDALIYSTCLPSTLFFSAVAIDSAGMAYVTGSAPYPGMPTTPNAFQSQFKGCGGYANAFFSVFDPSASGSASLTYSTYFGATGYDCQQVNWGDQGQAITVDAYGMAYVTGWTAGPDFPVTAGAYLTTLPASECWTGCQLHGNLPSAFVAKFNPRGVGAASLIYSTFLGGSWAAQGNGIAFDSLGNAYVTGLTGDYAGIPGGNTPFPTTPGAFQTVFDGQDAFVTKFNAAGNGLIYSTLLGGSLVQGVQGGTAVALDALNEAYVTGSTNAPNFPTTPNAFQPNDPNPNGPKAFVTQFNSDGTGLIYSSFLGGAASSGHSAESGGNGIAVDQVGDAYLTGTTWAIDFPVTLYPFQPSYAGNGDAFVTKFPIGAPGGLSITGVLPPSGGNVGTVTSSIIGTGFREGAAAQLSCSQGAIPGTSVTVTGYGQLLTARFDLTGATPGQCDVVVTNPGNLSARLPHSFAIIQGGGPELWTTVVGHSLGTGHPPSTFVVTVGNRGNTDAVGVLVSIYGIPNDATFGPQFTLATPEAIPGQPPIDFSGAPFAPVDGQEQIPTLIIPLIPAGFTIELPFILGVNSLPPPPPLQPPPPPPGNPLPPLSGGSQIDVTSVVTTLDTFFGSGGSSSPSSAQCGRLNKQRLNNLDCLGNVLMGLINQISCLQCLQPIMVPQAELLLSIALRQNLMTSYLPQNFDQWGAEIALSCGSCAAWLLGAPAWVGWMGTFTSTMLFDCVATANEGEGQFGVAVDPNDKQGPQGWNSPNWIQGNQSLAYSVYALNEPGAGAAAQQVAITDMIDPGLDPSTISLNGIVIGTLFVPLPPTFDPVIGQYQANTLIDYRPAESLVVYVTVTFNPATNTLSWQFASIDPTTGLPPTNQLIGVLPPGVQGAVLYSATPKQSSRTGTQISNFAGVSFNGGTPQNTPTWTNTLDNTPPTSQVLPLPGGELCSNFNVQWSGNDIGSGIANFTIYASDNGAPFAAWLTNTTSTSAVFNGQVGHSYGFYSIAQDLVGNIEPGKSAAEASTHVIKDTGCGPIGPPTVLGQRH